MYPVYSFFKKHLKCVTCMPEQYNLKSVKQFLDFLTNSIICHHVQGKLLIQLYKKEEISNPFHETYNCTLVQVCATQGCGGRHRLPL